MSEEPRRSVRATKGQHTKSLDILDQTAEPKKKSTKKASKKSDKKEEEEEELIRCVCGATETTPDDEEPWIACDKCESWQHNICVGITRFSDDQPDNYMCEQCDPQFPLHKELLDGLKKGRKLWEERRRIVEEEMAEEEKQGPKKKAKKAKGKRVSDQSEASHANGSAKSPSAPVVAEKKETVARAGSTKRKTRDESHDKDSKEPKPKVRKVSTAQPSTQSESQKSPSVDLGTKIKDLENPRQGIATLVMKGLQPTIKVAIQKGVYTLRENDTVDAKAERLALDIEGNVYNNYPDRSAYAKQGRTITFNLKQNQELCNGLLTGTLSPLNLALMSTDDMASKELKRETAEMKARADKQSIMITEEGAPRVRRTHKGDEIVEDDSFAVANDNTATTSSRRRSMLDPNAAMATRSRENSPYQIELPEDIGAERSHDDIRAAVAPKQPLTVETKQPTQPSKRKASTQADFDINKVFSSVQSPVNPQHIRRPSGNTAPPADGPGVDPEIDKLLQDDDANESPPYSPAEENSDPEIVWRGTVTMDSIAKFPAVAKHIAGADVSGKFPWPDVLQKELKVAGRIDQEKANEYLCSLRYSPPTDVVIFAVTPVGEAASEGFLELFNYFHAKNRFGVLTNKGIANIRDTYLVPVSASPGKVPDFIINLDGQRVPENRPDPMILVALVIRSEWHPDPPGTFDGNSDPRSPSVMGHPQRQMSMSNAPPAMSPIVPQGSSFAASPATQNSQYMPGESPSRPQPEEDRIAKQRAGEATAVQILGPHLNAPTVAFLMPQAYQMRPLEWEIIRAILEEDHKAQHDLQHLSQVLEVRMAAKNQQGQA